MYPKEDDSEARKASTVKIYKSYLTFLKGPEINLDQIWWCWEMQGIYPRTIALVQPIYFLPIEAATVFTTVSLLL